MSTTLRPDAPAPVRPSGSRGRRRGLLGLVVGLVGLGLAVALPMAPVVAERTVVTWPAEGAQPTSTTALFVPYRPAEVHVDVPCDAVQAGLGDGERTTLVSTTLVGAGGVASGLVVDTEAGQVRVLANGRLVQAATPAATGCDVRVDADDTALTVALGDEEPVVARGEPVPEVFAFTTDLSPDDAGATTVTARTRTWFESAPSGLKLAMIAGQLLLVVGSLFLLSRWGVRPAGRLSRGRAVRTRAWWVGLGCDAAVVLALGLWAVIAPQTADDGYAGMTIRNGAVSGDIGNYYHWFNASEAPFTLVQQVVRPIVEMSAAPLWMRMPSVLVAIVTWFVLSRGVLRRVLPETARGPVASVLAALFFLAWWLPFNTGLRPEPFVALATVSVLGLLLRSTAPEARRPLLLLGLAALVAGLALSVTPSGVMALAPWLVLSPRIWRTVRSPEVAGGAPWCSTAAVAAMLAALAGTGLVVMFADQSWNGVSKATQIHTDIGPSLEWYEELQRYSFLLGGGLQGTATKRLAVLVTIAMLLVAVPLLARRLPVLRDFRERHVVTACAALPFALLFITPSKWSHHFGSIAGLGTVFLTVTSVMLLRVARSRSRDRVTVVTALAGTGVLALFVAMSFSGANGWLLYSDYGLPFRDAAVTPLGIPFDSPVTWVVLAAVAVGAASWFRSRRGGGTGGVSLVTAAPAVVAVAAVAGSVAVLLVGFTIAPLRQAEADSYSLAGTNLQTLSGVSCGIADSVDVLVDDPDGPLETAGDEDETADGFVSGGGFLDSAPPPGGVGSGISAEMWGSFDGGEITTGTLVSRWFTLPELTDDQDVAVSASGRPGGANRVELEFGRSDDEDSVEPLSRAVVGDGRNEPAWRPLAVAPADVPDGADRVRVVATDATTDVGGWLAVTGPRVRTAQTLDSYLDDRGPVLPDWPLAWYLPCVENFPVVTNGLAQTPAVIIGAPDGYAGLAAIAYYAHEGGSFAGVSMATQREVPSRLDGAPSEQWGRVVELDYPLGRDMYDQATDEVTLWGWQGDR